MIHGLLLAALIAVQTYIPSLNKPKAPEGIEAQVKYICMVLEKDCTKLIADKHYPQIVYTDIGQPYGIYIPYVPDVIFVSSAIEDKAFQNQIIVHELTHYLDAHYGWSGWLEAQDGCLTEDLAFQVSNTYAIEFGGWQAWLWRSWYGC